MVTMVTRYLKIKLQFCQQIQTWNHLRKRYTTKSSDLVFVSLSNDIFMNLAFEDWLYENKNVKAKSILLLWKNKPTVVIGRHQNPYLECDVWKIAKNNLSLARRKSGGGAVYHDEGNINCSFIKDRSLYNRYSNLDLVVKALSSRWNVDLSINTREDILLDGFYKVRKLN